jgi:hypothetical protein
MLILMHERDLEQLPKTTPPEVREKTAETLKILDDNYGSDRKINDYGGYVVYVPFDESLPPARLRKMSYDIGNQLPEYVDIIRTATGDWLKVLYLFSSEYGVVLFIPRNAAPDWVLNEIEK